MAGPNRRANTTCVADVTACSRIVSVWTAPLRAACRASASAGWESGSVRHGALRSIGRVAKAVAPQDGVRVGALLRHVDLQPAVTADVPAQRRAPGVGQPRQHALDVDGPPLLGQGRLGGRSSSGPRLRREPSSSRRSRASNVVSVFEIRWIRPRASRSTFMSSAPRVRSVSMNAVTSPASAAASGAIVRPVHVVDVHQQELVADQRRARKAARPDSRRGRRGSRSA